MANLLVQLRRGAGQKLSLYAYLKLQQSRLVATIVVLASVAGAKAYLAFGPSALEVQAVEVVIPRQLIVATSTSNH